MTQHVLQLFSDGKNSYRWVVFKVLPPSFMESVEASVHSHQTQASALSEGTAALQKWDGEIALPHTGRPATSGAVFPACHQGSIH